MTLFSALSYKEWMKTRQILGIFLLIFAVAVVYSIIDIRHDIRIDGADNVWYRYFFQGASVAPLFRWAPALAGLAVALSQFVPEMTNKRLKLTLHLPSGETSIMACMLVYGVVCLVVLFAVAEVALVLLASAVLPSEIICSMLQQHLPWLASGIAAYGFTAWVCIEPQWKQRVCNAVIAVAGMSVLFVSLAAGAYIHFLLAMLVIMIVALLAPIYSCARFKDGIS